MRRFLKSGRRRYALAVLAIGVLVLTGCDDLEDLDPDPSFHDFGSVPLGSSSAPFRFTITHNVFGPQRPSTGALRSHVLGPFSAINDTCAGNNLNRGESCTIDVIYTPTALGLQTGFVMVQTPRDHTEDQTIGIEGTGIPSP